MIPYQLRPIDHWPSGERNRYPTHSPFAATWGATRDLLDRELRQLNARHVVMMIDVSSADLRVDGELRANARPASPAVVLAFESKFGPLKYSCDKFRNWQDNVRAIALGLEALRKVERYGIVKRGEQYTGWSQLPPATPMPAAFTIDSAAEFIARHTDDPNWVDEVRDDPGLALALFKDAAKILHPDAGGDPDEFKRLVQARDLIAEEYA